MLLFHIHQYNIDHYYIYKSSSGAFTTQFNAFALKKIKSEINPAIIIVFGGFIDGMTGKFVFYEYEDAWEETKPVEQFLFDLPKVINIPEEV